MKNFYQRVKVVLGKFDVFGKKFRKFISKGASFWFHNYTLVIWIKFCSKWELSSVTEISIKVLLGILKFVINCLLSYISKMIKKILPVTMTRQLNFARTLYCNKIENIIKFSIQSTLFTFHHTKFVLYNLLHFNETFFSRMFPGITLEGSHLCGEPTK